MSISSHSEIHMSTDPILKLQHDCISKKCSHVDLGRRVGQHDYEIDSNNVFGLDDTVLQ